MAQRIIDGQIEDRAEHRHPSDRNQKRKPVGPAEINREHDHQIGGDHRELALGEIDDTGRPKDQDEAQSDKSIDGADADTGEKQLEKGIHADRRAPRGMDPQAPGGACGGADQSVNSMCLSKTMVPLSLRTMLYPCRPSPNWSKLYSPSAPL